MKGEGDWGARLPGQTGAQVLRHRQDPEAVRKSPSTLCAAPPPKGGGERDGGGGGRGEQHRASLALAVTRAVVSWVAIVSGQAGLAVRPLGIVGAVTLTRLVVTVASHRVAVTVALARDAAATARQRRTEATRTAVLAVMSRGPVWKEPDCEEMNRTGQAES